MGRNVKVRATYRSDSTHLLRLITSIELDARIPPDTKRELMIKLREVAAYFMAMPTDLERG